MITVTCKRDIQRWKSKMTTAGLQFAIALGVVSISMTTLVAQDRQLIKVEEDWEVLITEADEDASSPQIINIISPTQDLTGIYGMIELNHSTFPSFAEGGLQLQARRGEQLTTARDYASGQTLRHNYDRLKYTVALRKFDDIMILAVKNVASKSWGNLKNDVMLLAFPSENFNLNDYSPDFSATASSVHVGAHRVASMYMTKSRKYYSNDDVEEDDTVRYSKRYLEIDGTIVLDYYSSVLE